MVNDMKKLVDILVERPLGADILPYCVEINPEVDGNNNFNRIRETLKRVGIQSASHSNTLNQSCHIFFHEGKYYLMHFLMMFMFDGHQSKLDEDDIKRTQCVAYMLEQWGLCTIVNKEVLEKPSEERFMHGLRVVKYRDSNNWTFRSIYKMRKETPNG